VSDSPSSLQPTFRIVSSRSDGELEDSDAFNDGILQVYGPPTTRPRLSDVDTDLCSSVFPDSVLQPPMLDSEEQPVLPIDNMNSQQTDARPSHLLISQSDPVLPSVTFEGHSTIPAAVPTVDSKNDGLVDDRPTSPIGLGSSGGFRQIIHDKDAKIPVLVDVAHQLSRVTADLTDDEQFEKLDSQIWKDGVLFYCSLEDRRDFLFAVLSVEACFFKRDGKLRLETQTRLCRSSVSRRTLYALGAPIYPPIHKGCASPIAWLSLSR
jgi:hypothetical protein